jgi:ATP-dependent DNA helicase DinG
VLEQLRARAAPSEVGMECAARPALDLVRDTARDAAARWRGSSARCWRWPAPWRTCWTTRPRPSRLRTRAHRRGAARPRPPRPHDPAGLALDAAAIDEDAEDDPDFVDWFDAT